MVKRNALTFESLSGSLFVKKDQHEIILDFPLQKTSSKLSPHLFKDLFKLADIVNAVQAYDDIIVELSDETLIRKLELDPARVKEIDCLSLIVTAAGTSPYDFVSRVFAPREGINEDPVTGSAHCKLADYWQKKLGKNELLAYQASFRGGILGVTIFNNRVHLKGQAVSIMEGTLKI